MTAPGKWGLPDFPKHGWECVGIEELDGLDEICQMCEVKEIRFVHIMEHPDGLSLGAGCVCAGKMEGSPTASSRRERLHRNCSKRLANWMDHTWKEHPSGTLTRTKHGCRCVLIPRNRGMWDGLVVHPDGREQWARHRRSLDDQKRKMFRVVDAGR